MRILFAVAVVMLTGCAGRQTVPETLEAYCAREVNHDAPICVRKRGGDQ